jgi:hypothetical protein
MGCCSWATKPIKKAVHAVKKGVKYLKDIISKAVKIIIDVIVEIMKFQYKWYFDDLLGLDDSTKLGSLIKDMYYDHAEVTALLIVIWFAWEFAPELISEAGAESWAADMTLSAYEAGITSTAGLNTVYYGSYALASSAASMTSGESLVVGGYSDAMTQEANEYSQRAKALQDKMAEKYKALQEQARILWQSSIANGSISAWMAGGSMRNECYAGGLLYNSTGLRDPNAMMFGYHDDRCDNFFFKNFTIKDQRARKNLAGDAGFNVMNFK